MFQISACLLTLIGVVLIYVTTRHQRLLSTSHPKIIAMLGGCLLLFALLSWMQLLTTTAAIFVWIFTFITMMISIPFSTLIRFRRGK
ncbi:hypothetical protein L2737_16845 [Shewanella electrodiphila]|uniref:Uncharacterized protein n=1 Tax=Shewanella electrodiphila TaxID=934143 RepID=A0ABT0KSY1_9GAMM|nr:hypothetical protein [Shewanella electrodiphila]MCL1046968.1 hypothetical protein [Shewanella electrodiphila]